MVSDLIEGFIQVRLLQIAICNAILETHGVFFFFLIVEESLEILLDISVILSPHLLAILVIKLIHHKNECRCIMRSFYIMKNE